MKREPMIWLTLAVLGLSLGQAGKVQADWRSKAATEAAEVVLARFGVKAGKSVPALARRIETLAARHGDDAIVAVRKVGPEAFTLLEKAGENAPKAVRVLATHGEAGAVRVIGNPQGMKQFLRFGDEAAHVLVKHPGIAERVIERGGMSAVKAMNQVTPRNGRRIAMLLEGDLAKVGRHSELLEVIARTGDRGADWVWRHKGSLAVAAALAVFLTHPEECINGTKDITKIASAHVVEPTIDGIFTTLQWMLGALVALAAVGGVLVWKHGFPKLGVIKALFKVGKGLVSGSSPASR